MHKGFSVSGSGAPFLDLVSQTPRPMGRGRPLFADLSIDLDCSETDLPALGLDQGALLGTLCG